MTARALWDPAGSRRCEHWQPSETTGWYVFGGNTIIDGPFPTLDEAETAADAHAAEWDGWDGWEPGDAVFETWCGLSLDGGDTVNERGDYRTHARPVTDLEAAFRVSNPIGRASAVAAVLGDDRWWRVADELMATATGDEEE